MVFLQIAYNSLLRNKRRTVITFISIIIGIAIIVFTNGFNSGMNQQWANAIINKTDGHLQIHHKDYYKYAVSDMKLISMKTPETIIAAIQKNPHVVNVMPRIAVSGFIGKDESSTTFYGAFSDLSQINTVLPEIKNLVVEGQALSPDDPNGILIGKELAKSINAALGDELVIVTRTMAGNTGSALVHVRGLLQDTKDEAWVQRDLVLGGITPQIQEDLLEIGKGVTELVVRVDKMKNVNDVVNWLTQRLTEDGQVWVANPWNARFEFQLLTALFNGISIIILIILTLIISFIISNSLLMSIFERIREVGSMRAIGMDKSQVYRLFYIEYLLLASIGGILGLITGSAIILIGSHTGVSISSGMFANIYPVLELSDLTISFLIPLVVAAVMALFPIYSACRMSVVESINYS